MYIVLYSLHFHNATPAWLGRAGKVESMSSINEDAELARAIRLSAAEWRRQNNPCEGDTSKRSSLTRTSAQLRAAGQSAVALDPSRSATPLLAVGDRVQIRPGLERPLHGWGPVERKDVGTVMTIIPGSPATCAVSFGAKTEPLGQNGWMCALSDLIRVSGSSGSSGSSSLGGMTIDTSGDAAMAAMINEQELIESHIRQQRQSRRFQAADSKTNSSSQRFSSPGSYSSSALAHRRTVPNSLRQQSITSISPHQKRFQDEQEASSALSQIVASCMQNNITFMDPEFPTTFDSLYGHKFQELESQGKAKVKTFGRAYEARCADMQRGQKWVVFRGNTPAPEDIQQGALGDCYFLSALACLAQRPELIKRLFVGPTAADLTNTISQFSCYQINLCKDGKWTIYTIDDMLPFLNGHLAYTKGARMQLWPALLEKAFAKAHGSYGALVSGQCSEALSILTGSPTDSFQLCSPGAPVSEHLSMNNFQGTFSDTDLLWINLESYQAAGFLMACACHVRHGGDNSAEDYKAVGLQTSHAYSLLQVKSVRISGGASSGSSVAQLLRLVQLRNPWGRFGWKG